MNIEHAKSIINSNYMKHHIFQYKGSRNQIEKFSGYIYKVFPVVFLIKLDTGEIKCFSYTDIITNSLIITI